MESIGRFARGVKTDINSTFPQFISADRPRGWVGSDLPRYEFDSPEADELPVGTPQGDREAFRRMSKERSDVLVMSKPTTMDKLEAMMRENKTQLRVANKGKATGGRGRPFGVAQWDDRPYPAVLSTGSAVQGGNAVFTQDGVVELQKVLKARRNQLIEIERTKEGAPVDKGKLAGERPKSQESIATQLFTEFITLISTFQNFYEFTNEAEDGNLFPAVSQINKVSKIMNIFLNGLVLFNEEELSEVLVAIQETYNAVYTWKDAMIEAYGVDAFDPAKQNHQKYVLSMLVIMATSAVVVLKKLAEGTMSQSERVKFVKVISKQALVDIRKQIGTGKLVNNTAKIFEKFATFDTNEKFFKELGRVVDFDGRVVPSQLGPDPSNMQLDKGILLLKQVLRAYSSRYKGFIEQAIREYAESSINENVFEYNNGMILDLLALYPVIYDDSEGVNQKWNQIKDDLVLLINRKLDSGDIDEYRHDEYMRIVDQIFDDLPNINLSIQPAITAFRFIKEELEDKKVKMPARTLNDLVNKIEDLIASVESDRVPATSSTGRTDSTSRALPADDRDIGDFNAPDDVPPLLQVDEFGLPIFPTWEEPEEIEV